MYDACKITMEEYRSRRQILLSKMPNDSIAILYSGQERRRNGDTDYPFRQNSDFYYLTGFPEPEAVMVLMKDAIQETHILFCRSNDAIAEIWTGARVGIKNAVDHYLADKAYDIKELDTYLPGFLENKQHIFYTLGNYLEQDNQVIQWVRNCRKKMRSGISVPEIWHNLAILIHEQRLFKSQAEIKLMRKAALISANAHKTLMQRVSAMEYELELEGCFLQGCCQEGAKYQAYPSIVGSGKNACVLHYTENTGSLGKMDLILVDAGSEYHHYASDITRTFPRSGQFTKDQKALYNVVLEAQLEAIALVRPGLAWNIIQEKIVSTLVKGLIKLGILQGDEKKLLEQKAYQRFYMHSSGHWLGLDVHDVGDYKINGQWRKLEVGMVFTIEPGIYISANQSDVDERWWNMGIRIEDDILVTEQGCEVLSEVAPKTVEEIEACMQQKKY